MKPIIGLIPLVDEERESLWMLPGYMDGIAAAGATSMMLPLTDDREALERLVACCDGILLTGGHDVDPSLYHEDPLPEMHATSPERDRMEVIVMEIALRDNKQILGICRGHQFMNAYFGGTLYQDLPTQHPSEICHKGHLPYDNPVHDVDVVPGTPLAELTGCSVLHVNSLHHQAVKALAPGLQSMAVSTDGLNEAFCMPDRRFIWGIQWHPEFAYKADPSCMKIFEAFAESCRK